MRESLDWLLVRWPRIEKSLANRNLKGDNALIILFDLSSDFLEGEQYPPAAIGHSQEVGKKDMLVCYVEWHLHRRLA